MIDRNPPEEQTVDLDSAAIDASPPEAVDNDDGTTTVALNDAPEEKPSSDDHTANLALSLPDDELDELARRYLDLIDRDIKSREDRDKQYADGLKKTGIASPAPGGANFEGASRATHPVLAEAYVDFAASAIKELFPPNGPVRTKIEGKPNHIKTDKAARKSAYMNWQLTQEIREYRGELERLLAQLPAGGTQFLKIYQNEDKGRQSIEFVPIDNFILPYNAKNFYDCQRKFHRMEVSELSYDSSIESGVYRDWSLPDISGSFNEQTKTEKQNEKIEGKSESGFGEDHDRLIYEGVVYEQLDGDDRAVPYLITIDDESKKVLGLYRNWAEDDEKFTELEYIVDFNFIPWRGAYAIGLPQLIGGLSDAVTGALRALLDSALISNMPGGIKLKSAQGGANIGVDPTQITEMDGLGSDDIRKIAMPFPFSGPSPVLFQLLGFLTDAAKGVVGTAEEKIADASNMMPMGTALALIEQGAKVFSAIHARLHDSQRRVLEIIHRLNAENMPDKVQFGSDPQDFVMRSDFEGRIDVHPVSDPNIFSETQRFAQIQAIVQLVTQLAPVYPAITQQINVQKLLQRSFEMMKFPDYEEILPPQNAPMPTNAADENVNLVMGKAVKAFTGQDHQAHIQVHLDFAQSPYFGLSPVMPPTFATAMLNHVQDHLLTFYDEMMKLDAGQALGNAQANMDSDPQASEALAKASPAVMKATQIAFEKIPDLMNQALQHIKKNAPQPPQDPMVAVAAQKVQSDAQLGQARLSLQDQKQRDEMQHNMSLLQTKMQELQDYMALQDKKLAIDAQTEIRTTNMKVQADLAKTYADNQTAMDIAAAKIAADQATDLRDGASLSENPKGGV